jgi:hypothetical protein
MSDSLALQKIDEMVTTIYQKYMAPSDDPRAAIANMAERILVAQDFESMFDTGGLEPTADLFNTGLHIEAINFNTSDYQAGLPFYATFRGKKISDGSDFICNCGAWQAVTVAYMMLEHDWLPRNMTFIRLEAATRAGYHPVNILPWSDF